MASISVYPKSNSNDPEARVEAGTAWDQGASSFRYVQVEDLALAAGDVVELSDATGGKVTKDRVGGSSLGRITVAGVALGEVADGNFGVIQTGGVALMKAASAIAAGTRLVPSSTDGLVEAATTSNNNVFAVSLGTETATTSGAGTIRAKIIRAL